MLIQLQSLMAGGQIAIWLHLGDLDHQCSTVSFLSFVCQTDFFTWQFDYVLLSWALFLVLVGRLRPATLFGGSTQATRPYIGSFGYQQPLPYSYQQGMMYPSYG